MAKVVCFALICEMNNNNNKECYNLIYLLMVNLILELVSLSINTKEVILVGTHVCLCGRRKSEYPEETHLSGLDDPMAKVSWSHLSLIRSN